MRLRGSSIAEHLPPFLAGLGVPLLTAMLFLLFQEAGSALIRSDPTLTKAQHILRAGRIGDVARWTAPAVNALLTAFISRRLRSRGPLPVLTALGSTASFLAVGLLFGFSFSFWQGGIGLWYALGLPGTFAAGLAGALRGQYVRERWGTLTRILEGTDGGVEGVRDAVHAYASFASVPAILAVLDGSVFLAADRRLERHRAALEDAGRRLAAMASDAAPDRPGPLAARAFPPEIRGTLAGCGIRSILTSRLGDPEGRSPSLLVACFTKPAFAVRGERQLRLLATQLSLRMENARLLGQARRTAVLEERQRLAREIHDTVAQDLIGIVVNLEALEREYARDPGLQGRVRETVRAARGCLRETRNLVWALRPPALEENPLPVALSRSLREWSDRTGTASDFRIEGDPVRLRPDAEITLLRMLQEACSNAKRHARARHVEVRLRFGPDGTVLSIRDDGIGMNGPGEGGGFGLSAMRERIEALGGTLAIRSGAGEGTELSAALPRPAAAGDGEDGDG